MRKLFELFTKRIHFSSKLERRLLVNLNWQVFSIDNSILSQGSIDDLLINTGNPTDIRTAEKQLLYQMEQIMKAIIRSRWV